MADQQHDLTQNLIQTQQDQEEYDAVTEDNFIVSSNNILDALRRQSVSSNYMFVYIRRHFEHLHSRVPA